MAHKHSVYDTDLHFVIDPVTRKITTTSGKVMLMQNDHNSERFTFQLPRYVEGHDMSLCNIAQVHYINASGGRDQHSDIYEMTDFGISPESNDVVIGSWLISGNATQYNGTLNFVIRFACVSEDTSEIEYQWFTDIYTGISIGRDIYNTESMTSDDSIDILAGWKKAILDMVAPYVDEIKNTVSSAEEAVAGVHEAAEKAAISEANAKESEINAKGSEDSVAANAAIASEAAANAKASETVAKESADTVMSNITSTLESVEEAKKAADQAVVYADKAETAEKSASNSSTAAASSSMAAATSASTAASSASSALASELNAKNSETKSIVNSNNAESYAVGGTGTRDGEDEDNAKYYSDVAKNMNTTSQTMLNNATEILEEASRKLSTTNIVINFETGNLECTDINNVFSLDYATGNLECEGVT